MHTPSTTPHGHTLAYESRLGPALIDNLVHAYVNGASVSFIAAHHRLSAAAVAGVVRRRCHTLRRGPEYLRKHHPIVGYFDVIDTEEKAYILGFFTADGCVHAERNAISIELGEKDRAHLERMRDALSPGQEVRPHVHRGHGRPIQQWRLNIVSRELVAALAHLGVGPVKSVTVRPAENVPSHLLRHYWRGVFDGDGCISRRPGKVSSSRPAWHFELTGSRAMCDGFRGFLRDSGVETAAVVAPAAGVARFGVGGQRLARRVAATLYADCAIALPRKRALADAVLAQSGRVDSRSKFLALVVGACHEEGLSLSKTAARLRVSQTTVWKIRKTLGLGRTNRKPSRACDKYDMD